MTTPEPSAFYYRTDAARAEAILLRGFAVGGAPWSGGPRVSLTNNPNAAPGNAVLRVVLPPDIAQQVMANERPKRPDGVRCFVVTPEMLETAEITMVDQGE